MGRSRGSLALLLVMACGGAHPPALVPFDAFEGDPVSTLADLERRLVHARAIDVDGVAGAMRGELHVEPQRGSWVQVSAPRRARWSSDAPRDRRARDTDAAQWGDSLLLELVRAGLAPTWRAVLDGEDPDIFHGDVDGILEVDHVQWQGRDPSSRTLTFTLTDSEDGVHADVALTLDARGLPVRRVEDGAVETYSRFDVQ